MDVNAIPTGNIEGFSRIMIRPAGRVTGCSNVTGPVGSGQEVFKISRIGSDRFKRYSNIVGGVRSGKTFSSLTGRVGLGRVKMLSNLTDRVRSDQEVTTRGSGQHDSRVVFCSSAGRTRAFGSPIRHLKHFPLSYPKACLVPILNHTPSVSYLSIQTPPNP